MTTFGLLSMILISCFYRQYKNKLVYTSFFYLYLVILDVSALPIVSLLFQIETEKALHIDFFRLCMPIISSILIVVTVRLIVQYINRNQCKKSRLDINVVSFIALLVELVILIYGILLSERRSANLEVLSITLFFVDISKKALSPMCKGSESPQLFWDLGDQVFFFEGDLEPFTAKESGLCWFSRTKYTLDFEYFQDKGHGDWLWLHNSFKDKELHLKPIRSDNEIADVLSKCGAFEIVYNCKETDETYS